MEGGRKEREGGMWEESNQGGEMIMALTNVLTMATLPVATARCSAEGYRCGHV